MRSNSISCLVVAALAVGACKKNPVETQAPASANATGTAMMPEHGGVVATSGGMMSEVVAQADGKLMVYVRGPQGAVREADVKVNIRNADGSTKPVVVAWDGQTNAYVGYVWGVAPGAKTVEVGIPGARADSPTLTVSAQVNVTGVAHPPAPHYGGSVEIIGQYAVEIVPSRSGDIAFFVMDLEGNLVPDASIELPRVVVSAGGTATTGTAGSVAVAAGAGAAAAGANGNVAVAVLAMQPVVVPVQRQGDHFVAHIEGGLAVSLPSVSVGIDLSVGGRAYTKATVPTAIVLPVMPPAIVVAAHAPALPSGAVVVVPPSVGAAAEVRMPAGAMPAAHVEVGARVGATVVPPSAQVGVRIDAPRPGAVVGVPTLAVPGAGVNIGVAPSQVNVVVAPPRAGAAVVVAPPAAGVGVVVAPPRAGVTIGGSAGGVAVGGGGVVVAPPRPQLAVPQIPTPPVPPSGASVGGSVQFGGSINIGR